MDQLFFSTNHTQQRHNCGKEIIEKFMVLAFFQFSTMNGTKLSSLYIIFDHLFGNFLTIMAWWIEVLVTERYQKENQKFVPINLG